MTDAARLGKESADLLSELIRFNTTNPPGDELACARYLTDWLAERGLTTEVAEFAPNRASGMAYLAGDRDEKPLLVMGHLDVVPVGDLSKWTRDPFGGEIADGCVWGRGAIDCKGVLVAQAVALAEMARNGETTGRPVRLLATADEEVGGSLGIAWLLENRPQWTDCWLCVTEGGGDIFSFGEQKFAGFMVGEKGQLQVSFTARGKQGHASLPPKEIAAYTLGEVLRRLEQLPPRYRLMDSNRSLLDLLIPNLNLETPADWENIFQMIEATLPGAAIFVKALYTDTISPTMLQASSKINILPGEAKLTCDCRLLPGTEPAELVAVFKELVSDLSVEVVDEGSHPASLSTVESPVVSTIRRLMEKWEPGTKLVPTLCQAATDSRQMRWAGYDSYGYVPFPASHDPLRTEQRVHGIDERIELETLTAMTVHTLDYTRELRKV